MISFPNTHEKTFGISEGDSPSQLAQRIGTLTKLSVARGVGFASILTLCFMGSFSDEPFNMMKSAGVGSMIMAITLFFKSIGSSPDMAARTEVALMLSQSGMSLSHHAKALICDSRRRIFLQWSGYAALVSLGCFMASTALVLDH